MSNPTPMKMRNLFQNILKKNLNDCHVWEHLSVNPNAIQFLQSNIDNIHWCKLSSNQNAFDILEKHIGWNIDWRILSENPCAIDILKKHPNRIWWDYLSKNPNAIPLIEENLNKVDWANLSSNPNAIHILEKNLDKVNWMYLSKNPNAIRILEKNLDKIDWNSILMNPNAIKIIENNLDKIKTAGNNYCRYYSSENPNAVYIYLDTPFQKVFENPAIFTYDYKKMVDKRPWRDEFYFWVHHPDQIGRHVDWGLADELLINF